MSLHLQRELDLLKRRLLNLCGLAEQQVHRAIEALLDRDLVAAQQVEDQDALIDQQEVELEEECLKILALHQPVASDLRFIISALKINNDLERIGDLAVNLAHKARTFAQFPEVENPFDLSRMAQQVQGMLRDSVNAMVRLDPKLAQDVCARDAQINEQKHQIRLLAEQLIQQNPHQIKPILALAAAARNLERIADHATNIAEDVIYLTQGSISRHQHLPPDQLGQ
ncbi:MAG: phosphate signaling complex protein PhoU [Thermoguttaceae bacterium]|nr:phosphate signaling complex protein PhoU [Thermoguttaceae bacterium]MDW8036528.1 phosphate signaling complex protein PhoU [Thermoguttaceae bacterium]